VKYSSSKIYEVTLASNEEKIIARIFINLCVYKISEEVLRQMIETCSVNLSLAVALIGLTYDETLKL